MLRALAFDFDGLIIDSETAVFQAWQATYAEFGVEFPLGLWRGMVGTRELDDAPWRHLEAVLGEPVDRDELGRRKRERSIAMASVLPTLPGVRDLIDGAERAGIPLAVASSSGRWWVENHLERLGILDRFALIRTAEHAGVGKPAPDVYLAVLEALGIDGQCVVALEDSQHGVAAAKAAGVRAVAVPGSFSEAMDFSAADLVVPSLSAVTITDLERLVSDAR